MDVAVEFQLSLESLFLAVRPVDVVLERQQLQRQEFQLLGEACLLIAA